MSSVSSFVSLPRGRASRWSVGRWILVVLLLINGGAFLLGGMRLWEGHRKAGEQAEQTTRGLVQVLNQSLVNTARSIDLTLHAVVGDVEAALKAGHLRDEELRATLGRFKSWLPEAEAIRVFDERGRPRWVSEGSKVAALDISDRAYFSSLRDQPDPGMVVSMPLQGRITGNWAVVFARRITHPDGRFAGIATAVVPVDRLQEILASVSLGHSGIVALRHASRALVAMHPRLETPAAQVGSQDITPQLRAILDSGQTFATYHVSRMQDGLERINTVRRVNGLPFLLVVGMASSDYLQVWRSERDQTVALLGLFVLVTSLAGLALGRTYGRLQEHAGRLGEALAALHDRDRVLAATEQISQLGTYSIDPLTGQGDGAPQTLRIFGLDPDHPDKLVAWLQGIHPEDKALITEAFMEGTMVRGEAFDAAYRYVRPDGELRWIHGMATAETDGAGRALRVHGVVQDITERRQADAALKEALDNYQRLVTGIPVGIFKFVEAPGGPGRYAYVSPRMAEQVGLQVNEVLANPGQVIRRIHPDDRRSFFDALALSRQALEPLRWEGRILLDGVARWLSVQAVPRHQVDGSLLWEGVQVDTTARAEAETLLRESEARYRLLLQHLPVGILHYGQDLKVRYCNTRFAQIMGVPLEYMLNLDCGRLKDDRVLPALREALAGQVGRYEGPYQTSYADKRLSIGMNCLPLRLADGSVVGGMALVEDITERVRQDEELTRYRDGLEELVAARTADLVAARAEAERLARVKSEFLANMSHEIRTPLNGVLGLAHIGLRDSQGRTRETFARIITSGQLLLGIINDILDYSKIEAGKLRIEAIPVSLGKLVSETLDLMQERAVAKGLRLQFQKETPLPAACLADPLRVGQVLINLLSNALKFTEKGDVSLSVAHDGEALVFRVRDTGIGMTEEELATVFRPFEQADNSTTRRFGGTGLGLTITRRLVDLMGGRLTVASCSGAGSCFEVSLPCPAVADPFDAEAELRREQEGVDTAPRLAGLRVLVAEDNEVNQLVIEEMLSGEGAQVTLCSNGQEAVECLQSVGAEVFDVVLMDVQMPVMDGLEATRQIRALAPTLPVIGQTAHAFEEEKGRCRAAGMVAHLAKPLDPDLLVQTVRQHWHARRGGV
ncbi:ATP-binding protein [Zoogloea sp.]|uniref:ATP-binding protein n=1 Tax=Zoogloea sp. TaxID=49181 RepID=UPI00262D212C|nr:ATP-binding protein [Zoogloea sp.]MDD3353753.1 ATP-binding protein [Zoogloea sp.]